MNNQPYIIFQELYFSYGQIMIYDSREIYPECDWTDRHVAQGFAKRISTVCFGTILEYGYADVTIFMKAFASSNSNYARAISVPFSCLSGSISIRGPEEVGIDRRFQIPIGHYRLTMAQSSDPDHDREIIEIYFEILSEPAICSEIVIADDLLEPAWPLLETADIPEI